MSHLLSLSELHAAAPGVLDVVFGADGEFEGAPEWRPALYMLVGRRFVHDWQRTDDVIWLDLPPHGRVAHGQVALDLRTSAAQRIARLCCRAADPRRDIHTWRRAADLAACAARCEWPAEYAATLSALCIALAPNIRDLSRRES